MMKRDVAVVVLLTVFTCGIYSIYWAIVNNRDAKESMGFDGPSSEILLLLSIVTCGIYLIYWKFKITEHISGGEEANFILILGILSMIPTIGFIALAFTALKMQTMINEVATK